LKNIKIGKRKILMSSTEIWKKVGKSSGLLTDEDIILLGNNNLLISGGFDVSQVKQTCYELRVGRVAYFLAGPESEGKKTIDEQNPLIVRPQEVVTIITYEEVNLPDFILGRIISKGHLFSIGLSPVITYADPGFSGNLGITFINLSRKIIKFGFKDAICKIEFEKLGKAVRQPYRGPHGFATQIWPIDRSRFMQKREIGPKEILDDELLRADAEYFGEPFDLISERLIHVGNQIRSLKSTLKFVFVSAISIMAGAGLFLAMKKIFSILKVIPEPIQSGIVSGVVSGIFTILAVILEWRLLKKRV
jgi:dCTP deaminase